MYVICVNLSGLELSVAFTNVHTCVLSMQIVTRRWSSSVPMNRNIVLLFVFSKSVCIIAVNFRCKDRRASVMDIWHSLANFVIRPNVLIFIVKWILFFAVLGFCTIFKASLLTTFRKSLWGHMTLLVTTSEDGTHSEFRNVVSKFISHIVQKPRNQETKLTLRCDDGHVSCSSSDSQILDRELSETNSGSASWVIILAFGFYLHGQSSCSSRILINRSRAYSRRTAADCKQHRFVLHNPAKLWRSEFQWETWT
jgi:hypothetical protein